MAFRASTSRIEQGQPCVSDITQGVGVTPMIRERVSRQGVFHRRQRGGMSVHWIYTPIVHNDSTEWPDEGGLISKLFDTVTLLLFGYLWRVIQR